MSHINVRTSIFTAVSLLVSLSACKNSEDYRNERADYAVKHFERAQLKYLEEGKKMTLVECIETALKHNLDLKVFQLEEAVARETQTAEMLGMLPELNVANNLTSRNNTPASSSKKIAESGETFGASTSQDETVNYVNVDLVLSALDFGLAWFNTQQAKDRTLMREQRTRRAAQNLSLDIVKAYFQVAAAQRSIKITKDLLDRCRHRYQLIDELARSRQITPFRAFDETRRFVQMEKRLTNYIRTYENACVELRSLLGYYPNTNIMVDDTILDKLPDLKLPEIIVMEQIALLERPELYEIDMNKHINIIECRKTVLMMFPNVRIFLDFTNNNNTFLYNKSWWEIGVRAAYNLLKLPQQIARYQAYSSQVDAQEARTWAQAIGVMAQVRIAHANILASKERFDIDEQVYKLYSKNLKWAEANQLATGELSRLELEHIRLETAETEIDCLITRSNYYIAYYRLLNSLGVQHLDAKTTEDLKQELERARVRAEEEIKKQKEEIAAATAAAAFPEQKGNVIMVPEPKADVPQKQNK